MSTLAVWGSAELRTRVQHASSEAGASADIVQVDGRKKIASLSDVVAILIDARDLSGADRTSLPKVVRDLSAEVPVSVLFDLMTNDEIRSIGFGEGAIDVVVEVRVDDDLDEAIAKVVGHLATLTAPVPDGAVKIGSQFESDPADFARDRIRSLVSNRMGEFNADLRDAIARLRDFPLRDTLPWADDDVPTRLMADGMLNDRTTDPPRLSDVLAAVSSKEAQARLAGDLPEDGAWKAKWLSRPPLVLLTGESGTGKTLVAQTVAELLTPPGRPLRFVKINSAGLTLSTFEHLLHGAPPRAWSGIDRPIVGQLTRAAHGVVFFDEIGDLQPEIQAALLTYFDERLVRPTGMPPFPAYQHIIAATNRDLEAGTREKWFRNDLLARFAIRIEVPPLRDRGGDEVRQLIDLVAQDPRSNPPGIGGVRPVTHFLPDAIDEIAARDYAHGNFRELSEVVQATVRAARRRWSRVVTGDDVRTATAQRPAR